MADSTLTKVLIVGMGDLGAVTARLLVQSGIQVAGLKRTVASGMDESANSGIEMIAADVTQPSTLTELQSLYPDMIVYCVAASGQTDAEYKAAYVDGLRNVLATQANNSRLKHVFFVSSSRVYGQDTQALLDETTPALPADFGGQRLLEAEHLLRTLPCATTVLRLSGIYGPGRLRMLNLAKSPAHWPKQNTWSNRIHRDDAAAFITFLIHQVLAGSTLQSCYIVTDSRPVPQYEVLSWLATQLQMPKPAQLPASAGKRLSNSNMLATGFKLQYADYEVGYRTLLPPIPD